MSKCEKPQSPCIPARPWQCVHVDFVGPCMGSMFLVVVDAHSKWVEVIMMSSTTSEWTITKLRKLFAALITGRNLRQRSLMCSGSPLVFCTYVVHRTIHSQMAKLKRSCKLLQPLGTRSICCRSRKFVFGNIPMYNFSAVYFLYFLQALFVSDFTSRTPNKDEQIEQPFHCLFVQVL